MEQREAKSLREWRRDKFMNQEEFAAFLGYSVATYRAWEQGAHTPRYPQQREIAKKLKVHPSQVMYAEKQRAAVA